MTDDLFKYGISIAFDGSYFGSGTLCKTAIACHISKQPDFPPTPIESPFIVFNPAYLSEDPLILAAVLVHEGTHFQQFLDGRLLHKAFGTISEIDTEFGAFWNGAVFWGEVRASLMPFLTSLERDEEDLYNLARLGEAALRNEIDARY